MPKLYLAQQTNIIPTDGEPTPEPMLFASGSLTTLKKRMAEHKETEWKVGTVQVNTDVQSIIALVENPKSLLTSLADPEEFRINLSGQVRAK